MPSKLASIDIGTNSVRLLVAGTGQETRLTPVKTLLSIERLGEGLDRTGRLLPEAMERNAARVEEYVKLAENSEIPMIRIFGTAAVREASNREDFLRLVQEKTGRRVRILSGEEEADFTYLGTVRHLESLGPEENLLVLDIGGGSTEFTVGRGEIRRYSTSVKIGSVRLTERCVKTDPLSREDEASLERVIQEAVGEVVERIKKDAPSSLRLVGVAGSITSFRTIELGMTEYDSSRVQGAVMSRREVDRILDDLISKTSADRLRIAGLEAGRAQTILAGGKILSVCMRLLGMEEIIFSDRDGLYGALLVEEGWE